MTRTATLIALTLLTLSGQVAQARPESFRRISIRWEQPQGPTRTVSIHEGRVLTSRTSPSSQLSLSSDEAATDWTKTTVDVALRRVTLRGRRRVEGAGPYGELRVDFRDGTRLQFAAPWSEWRQDPWLAATARRLLELERKASRTLARSRYFEALDAEAERAGLELALAGDPLARSAAQHQAWDSLEFQSFAELQVYLGSLAGEGDALETLEGALQQARRSSGARLVEAESPRARSPLGAWSSWGPREAGVGSSLSARGGSTQAGFVRTASRASRELGS